MGNVIPGRKKRVKIMKINGETMKLKAPIQATDILKDHPGHVLLDSEAVKHFGIRSKPIEENQTLQPKRLYFLVELPKCPDHVPRKVRSGIQMSAKDRLESLMLARRSASDLTFIKASSGAEKDGSPMRVKMRLPKSEVARVIDGARNETEVAERIVDLCVTKSGSSSSSSLSSFSSVAGATGGGSSLSSSRSSSVSSFKGKEVAVVNDQNIMHRDHRKKKVGFLPVTQDEIRLAVAS
ncbi:hypothetical protein AKJ16_DCAP20687 [Drosera capensis]